MNKLYLFFLLVFAAFSVSCDELKLDKGETTELEKIIPEEVGIDIPSSLNYNEFFSLKTNVQGDEIYNYVRAFIYFADFASKLVENSYSRIKVIETPGIFEFSYTGIDGNTKNVSIIENYPDTIANLTWDYYMEIYNTGFADLALKAVWNLSPNEQKILFKPSSLNSNEMTNHSEALIEIEYKTESAAVPYEKSLYVAITGLSRGNEISYDPENIIVLVGQNGNQLEITGASSNPDVALLDAFYRGGRNWSFLAKMNIAENIAAVKLALPPSSTESIVNLFVDYSIKKALLEEIKTAYPGNESLSDAELFALAEIDASMVEEPGYFDENGFVAAGTAPSTSYSNLTDFESLVPFAPVFVRDYEIILSTTVAVEEEEK